MYKWGKVKKIVGNKIGITGKSLSEAHNKFLTCSELVVFMNWTGKSMNNLLSYFGLVDVRINASDKDLPVWSKNSHMNAEIHIWNAKTIN